MLLKGIPVSHPATLRAGLIVLAMLLMGAGGHAAGPGRLPVHDGIGGDFSAPSSLGREVRLSEFRGKVVLLFFGYTSCQDICPATLSHLEALVRRLGPAQEQVQVLLVSIDPENDTVEHLAEYLARFDPRFIGLTADADELARITGMFIVKHDRSHGMKVSMMHNRSKAFVDDAYLYSHSQQIYLLDKLGRTRGFYFTGSPLEEMEEAVMGLLAE
jgi:protein SCO1/2